MFKEHVIALLVKETKLKKDQIEKLIEIPPDDQLGDYAFPCFILAKKLKKNPVHIAQELAHCIPKPRTIERIEPNGPYVNFFINTTSLAENTLTAIHKKKDRYGTSEPKKETIMVEFFHANTHKGVHIGHIRNISIGEALCRLLEATGKKVIRVNYQGDIGPHVAKCLWGYIHFKDKPTTSKGVWLGKIYAKASQHIKKSKKAEQEMRTLNKQIYDRDSDILELWKKTRQWCLDDFNAFYKDFGVKYDRLYFESETEKSGKEVIHTLLKKKIAEESAGAIIVNLEKYKLGIYVGITQQGHGTYNAKDLGLALLKQKEYTFDRSIHVVGSEQQLYFKQLFKTFELMKSPLAGKSHHVSYGLVMLPEGKMSSRDGTMVLFDNLFEELLKLSENEITKRHKSLPKKEVTARARSIAYAALKYSMISRENSSTLIFDWEKALEFDGDTGPYVQYAHARSCSILRKADQKINLKVHFESLHSVHEKRLLVKLAQFEQVIQESAEQYKPYLIAQYSLQLAQAFNEFYHSCPVISDVSEVMHARLLLVHGVRQVLENSLKLLGIDAPEEM